MERWTGVEVDWRAIKHDPGLFMTGTPASAERETWKRELAEVTALALPAEQPPVAVPPLISNTLAALSAYTEAVTDGVQHELRRALFEAIWVRQRHLSNAYDVRTATSGYDPHKRVNGRKRHITVDTLGLLCYVIVTAANTHDQHVAPALLHDAADRGIRHIWADQGYHAENLIAAAKHVLGITLQIVLRPTNTTGRGHGFHTLPRRWVVERTNAWITRRRRCARDYERRTDHH
jgi:transposase